VQVTAMGQAECREPICEYARRKFGGKS